jgi:FKBP-type peptidyl-prolyl cis-trans isomerase (trigger factor)
LILKRLAREEGIEVEEADVDRRIEEKAAEFGTNLDTLSAELEEGGGKARLKDLLLAESVLEYLLENLQANKLTCKEGGAHGTTNACDSK